MDPLFQEYSELTQKLRFLYSAYTQCVYGGGDDDPLEMYCRAFLRMLMCYTL